MTSSGLTLASVALRTRVLIVVAGALFALSAAPATGQMSVAVKVFEDFVADGKIDPCKHSSESLRDVQRNIPPDIEQYAPEYPAAVAAALEARARGDCAGTKPEPVAPVASPTPTPDPTPVPTAVPTKTVVDEPPTPEVAPTAAPADAARPDAALQRAATARPANGAPAPVLLLALLGALLLAATAFALAARRSGWAEGTAHSWREASWRAGAVWDDFRDWLRLGK